MKVMVIFGTRPEAIKMCPVIKELEKQNAIETVICVTGQHKEMLRQVLDVFSIVPQYNLNIMKKQQTLSELTVAILVEIQKILDEVRPDLVLVHGDTTTAYASALACFYKQIPVGHVEAGLRTYDIHSPFPEEYNRQAIDVMSSLLFAPTENAKSNLINEKKDANKIFVTGNTVIDALYTTVCKDYQHEYLKWAEDSRLILLTAHRRENLGCVMEGMFRAVKRIVDDNTDVKVIYPVHRNPKVSKTAQKFLGGIERIKLIEPLDVIEFHNFMANSYMILTDSGGVQEEAAALGKPVLVMRDTTERPEGIEAGVLKLVGTETDSIYNASQILLHNEEVYRGMTGFRDLYGDGRAAEKIVKIILENCRG